MQLYDEYFDACQIQLVSNLPFGISILIISASSAIAMVPPAATAAEIHVWIIPRVTSRGDMSTMLHLYLAHHGNHRCWSQHSRIPGPLWGLVADSYNITFCSFTARNSFNCFFFAVEYLCWTRVNKHICIWHRLLLTEPSTARLPLRGTTIPPVSCTLGFIHG